MSDHIEAQMLMTRPWDAAEPDSIWEISGFYPGQRGQFVWCLAVVLPHSVTGGEVLFKMIGALDDLVAPAWITSGRLLVLVHADDPATPYFEKDQDYLKAKP